MSKNVFPFVVALLLACSLILAGNVGAAQSPQVPLAGSAIPQFVQELPTLSVNAQSIPKINTPFGNTPLQLMMCEFDAQGCRHPCLRHGSGGTLSGRRALQFRQYLRWTPISDRSL